MSLIKGKNIDISKIAFSQPRVLDNGAKLVYVNYGEGRWSIQTPWMTMPWKMGAYTEGDYPKYSIDLSFRGMDENPEMQTFHDKFKELEQTIIVGGVKNSVSWLKKPKNTSRDAIESLFNPIIKVSRDKETGEPDGKWPPLMKVKVPRRDGTWEFKLHDKDGTLYKINDSETPVDVEEMFVKNTKVRCIIQCVGLWIASGNYMCQWKLLKAEVDVPKTYTNEDFLSDSDDDGETPTMLEDSEDETSPNNLEDGETPVTMLEDSGDETSKNKLEDETSTNKLDSPKPVTTEKKKVIKRVVKRKTNN